MKKLLNTLYVTTQGLYLSKENDTLIASLEGVKKLQIPLLNLSGIVCFGNIGASPFLLGACAENNIGVSFLTRNGRFLGRFQGPVSGNVLLRREQYRLADDLQVSTQFARSFLIGKLLNSRSVIQRFLRDHRDQIDDSQPLEFTIKSLKNITKRFNYRNSLPVLTDSLNSLRGIEGDAAADYFSHFNHLIISQKNHFSFDSRIKRPPRDPVNALLSFVYTLLAHDVQSAIESVGLDPFVGFLHADRSGKPSLALDLMEEFRAYIADRMVLSLINLKQISIADFIISDTKTVKIKDEARKTILQIYQERKQDEITHPFLNEKIKIGLLPFVQSQLLARTIRKDLDIYPPFIVR